MPIAEAANGISSRPSAVADAPAERCVSVRALCEFAARQGDLDRRYTPATTPAQGIAGHACIQARRGDRWQAEVVLDGRCGPLRVRGRADLVWLPRLPGPPEASASARSGETGFGDDDCDAATARVQEIKTCRGDPRRRPPAERAVHDAQAWIYAHLLAERDGLAQVDVQTIYYDVDRDREWPQSPTRANAAALRARFETLCAMQTAWLQTQERHREARDRWLEDLRFPAVPRPGQRAMARAVWHAAAGPRRGPLSRGVRAQLIEAPTGTGKTLGVLYGAFKALAAQRLDRVVHLTARTTAKALALDAARRLCGAAAPIRVVEVTSLRDGCVHRDASSSASPVPLVDGQPACDPDHCDHARGFYDRLPDARAALAAVTIADRAAIADIAAAHRVCPVHLAHEAARWADVVVSDLNGWFDLDAGLADWSRQQQLQTLVVVDEAHQLPDRLRDLFETTLDPAQLQALLPQVSPAAAAEVRRVLAAWPRDCGLAAADEPRLARQHGEDRISARATAAADDAAHVSPGTVVAPESALSEPFLKALQAAIQAVGESIGESFGESVGESVADRFDGATGALAGAVDAARGTVGIPPHATLDAVLMPPRSGAVAPQRTDDPQPLSTWFAMILLHRLAQASGTSAWLQLDPDGPAAPARPAPRSTGATDATDLADSTDVSDGAQAARLVPIALRNIVPAPLVATALQHARATILLSATLGPSDAMVRALGLASPSDARSHLPPDAAHATARLDCAHPFDPSHLAVHVERRISTRLRHRDRSRAASVELIARQYRCAPGNYLAFFPSQAYLDATRAAFEAAHPSIPTWHQHASMSTPARAAFLARFEAGGHGIGFALLGGIFGEGVDLPGDRLVGAFIVGLGLPPNSALNELRVQHLARHLSIDRRTAHDHVYLLPAIRKVVQAAGRVIRTPDDRGVVWLLDDRYARREVRALLPAWWQPSPGSTTADAARIGL